MISKWHAQSYCCEDISMIENYELAVNDTELWDCHHRDEIRTLPSGMKVYRTQQELIDNGRYYDCPANELIFIKHIDHLSLHSLNRPTKKEWYDKAIKTRKTNSNNWHSKDTRKKISEARSKCNVGRRWYNDGKKNYFIFPQYANKLNKGRIN